MPYQISRGGQLYGPYTLEDLQRYITSGNVLPTDLAKSEEMAEWLPVSQILSTTSGAAAATTPAYTAPGYVPPAAYTPAPATYGAAASDYPDPPNLHWALVLLIGICTCGVFFVVWDLVQVLWMKRVDPQTKAMMYFIIYAAAWVLSLGGSFGRAIVAAQGQVPHTTPLSALLSIAAFILAVIYRFMMKASLEQHFNGPEPIGLRLGPVMTFFFGGIYFQYHLHRINEMKQVSRVRGY